MINEDKRIEEIMSIAQEECAEVIQAISKIKRFGLLTEYQRKTNKAHLEEEIGDLYCMFKHLHENGLIDWVNVEYAAANKDNKLKMWSNIHE